MSSQISFVAAFGTGNAAAFNQVSVVMVIQCY